MVCWLSFEFGLVGRVGVGLVWSLVVWLVEMDGWFGLVWVCCLGLDWLSWLGRVGLVGFGWLVGLVLFRLVWLCRA